MKIKNSRGTILTSENPTTIEQWKKAGYKDIEAARVEEDTGAAKKTRRKEKA